MYNVGLCSENITNYNKAWNNYNGYKNHNKGSSI